MRRVRIMLGFVAVVCAFSALTASAFGAPEKKPKLVFGHFVASIVGKTISKEAPASVRQFKEGETELTGLTIGQYRFGTVNEDAEADYEEPCLREPKVTGKVTEEVSSSLETEIGFSECVSSNVAGDNIEWRANNFKLAIKFLANEAAEVGKSEEGIEISKTATVTVRGSQKCVVEIPQQFIPATAEEHPEKFYEVAEYTPEEETPENWERSKKLKEEYPGEEQDRLGITTTEKFKGIVSYVNTSANTAKKGCLPKKGEESGKFITEKEIEVEGKMVPNPWYHWTEYRNGKIDLTVTGLEIKGGQLTFEPPA
jgi:hypothetical protein